MNHFRIGKKHHNYIHPCEPRYASLDTAAHKPRPNGTVKVITYNIRLSKNTHKALDLLAGHDDLNNADIICLQEMDPSGVEFIAHTLKYNYVYYPAILHPRSSKDFGNAVLSKWPIIEDQKVILPKLGRGKLQRIAVNTTLSINNTRVAVVCVHLEVFTHRHLRRVPIDCIIHSIEPSIKHCIIAGDFNTFSKSNYQAILEPFQEADFQHATEALEWTYKYWYLFNKKSSLDHIFTRGMHAMRMGKVPNRKPSDHIPIWGEMKLKD